jgi:hypothetical protein
LADSLALGGAWVLLLLTTTQPLNRIDKIDKLQTKAVFLMISPFTLKKFIKKSHI